MESHPPLRFDHLRQKQPSDFVVEIPQCHVVAEERFLDCAEPILRSGIGGHEGAALGEDS
jgi:hypothetical protein